MKTQRNKKKKNLILINHPFPQHAHSCHLHTLIFIIPAPAVLKLSMHLGNLALLIIIKNALQRTNVFPHVLWIYRLVPVGLQDLRFRLTERAVYTSQTHFLTMLRFILSISREHLCIDMNLTVNTPSVWATGKLPFHQATTICQP